jgi:hypothetical protein
MIVLEYMPDFKRVVRFALCALAFIPPSAHGQRAFITELDAWENPSTVMVTGKVVKVTLPRQSLSQAPDSDRRAYYDFLVSEWLKPRDSGLPQRITIEETWGFTDTAILRTGIDAILFLQERSEHFEPLREIYSDSTAGQQTIRGTRLFLRVMYTDDPIQRQKACLSAWNDALSDPEKGAVLDSMWETRTPEYSPTLLRIARGNHSPGVREWALNIVGSIGNSQGVEELVPLLLSEPSCQVKRQLLFVFGMYRVREAVTAIDELLASNQSGQCPPWQADALRARAQEARDKITGKEPGPGWRN